MEEHLVVFELSDETYGIDISRVQSIIQMQPLTMVPGSPAYIEGVINLRGRVTPVIDLRRRFELPLAADGQKQVIVIVELDDEHIGMIVDKVTNVAKIDAGLVEPPSPLLVNLDTAYLRGIATIGRRNEDEHQMIILLDVDRIITVSEPQRLKPQAA